MIPVCLFSVAFNVNIVITERRCAGILRCIIPAQRHVTHVLYNYNAYVK